MSFLSSWGPVAWILAIAVIILIIAIIYEIYRLIKKRHEGPDHYEEYFAANFRTMVSEWDLVTRPRLKEWKTGIMKRMVNITKDIEFLESARSSIDKRLANLDKSLTKLEKS
jgi:biopolymer transport protein ExbB/TolQ